MRRRRVRAFVRLAEHSCVTACDRYVCTTYKTLTIDMSDLIHNTSDNQAFPGPVEGLSGAGGGASALGVTSGVGAMGDSSLARQPNPHTPNTY